MPYSLLLHLTLSARHYALCLKFPPTCLILTVLSLTSSLIRGPMADNGRTSLAAPNSIALAGIPKTTHVSRCSAIVDAPIFFSLRSPSAPSQPMPVSSAAITDMRGSRVSELKRMLTLGANLSAATGDSRRNRPSASTSRCLSGGAT